MNVDQTTGRIIAIGDIHGCSEALRAVVKAIDPQPDDTIVLLGDYIDRGPDSHGVVEQVLAMQEHCEVVPLLGNHELMLLIVLEHPQELSLWKSVGGIATLQSYRDAFFTSQAEDQNASAEDDLVNGHQASVEDLTTWLPGRHLDFFQSCALAYETETHIFVHANYLSDQPIGEQSEDILLWQHLLHGHVPDQHISGKRVVVGHTPQMDGEILDLGHVLGIDTFCFGTGWLTALDVGNGESWQANKEGQLRES